MLRPRSPQPLFHLLTRAELDAAEALGVYRPPSLASEGFIHLSTEAQWRKTAERFFAGRGAMVLLEIDPHRLGDRLGDEVRFEPAPLAHGGDLFPHLYGPLPLLAVVAVHELEEDPHGRWSVAAHLGPKTA